MKTKPVPILLTILLAFALPLSASAAESPFSDVTPSAWYADAVSDVSAHGWMNSVGGGRFAPSGTLTRAMLVTILWRAADCPSPSGTAPFPDVTQESWYTDGLAWCAERSLITGYGNGCFGPNDAVTREQLAAVFYRYADNGAAVSASGKTILQNGSSWSAEACTWANAKGLFTDALGALDLSAPASRAEIAYWFSTYFSAVPTLDECSFHTDSLTLRYLLYTPGSAHDGMPLIVYLHGGHGKGGDLSILTDTDGFPQYLADGLLGEVPAYVLIPQLPADQRGWETAADAVMQLIDALCVENGIDRSRVSLAGHSMGGTGTWNLALFFPDTFSRIAPMSGSVQTTPEALAALEAVSVWAFVGENDAIVSPESSKQLVAALTKQKADARITVFPDTDHFGVPQKAWLENGTALLDWLTA